MIPYGKHCVSDEDIDAVVEVLRSDWLTQGPTVTSLEQAIASYCQADFCVAVNSATSALHLACLALELGEGDWLWTTPITFVASSNCALYTGARVDFVDVEYQTGLMSVAALADKLHKAKRENRLPKVVVPVHFAGQSCDMEAIHKLSCEYGFKVIEDASHAIGGRFGDYPIGACQFSDITVFSLHPVKIITAGEGGLALTNNPLLHKKILALRSHGITRDPQEMLNPPEGDWYYEQQSLGFNYRMTDIAAALCLSQLNRLDTFVRIRNQKLLNYQQLLKDQPVEFLLQRDNNLSACHLAVIKINPKIILKSRAQVFAEMRASDIGVNVHYIPVHLQPYYQKMGFIKGDFPLAEKFYDNCLSLPLHPQLSESEQLYIVDRLKIILYEDV